MEEKQIINKTWQEIDEAEHCWLWLCSIPELTQGQRSALIRYFGTPEEVYRAPEQEFQIWKKTGCKWVDGLLQFRRNHSVEAVCHSTAKKGISFISRKSERFPDRLKTLPDCPDGLFYRGSLPSDTAFSAAVVGARQCSSYGRMMAEQISQALAEAGVQIISGLAMGIDGLAQRRALQAGGMTFSVLGCGPDICYPRDNLGLFQEILEKGGVISEFPPGSPPVRWHFPLRNRIISGLSDAVIVVEAKERSGSLITADLALDQGREVYAVPGRSTDVLSGGCNRLIAQGAGIILSPEQLLEELGLERNSGRILQKKQVSLAPEEELVYSNLDLLPKGLEELSARTSLPIGKLAGILLKLQLSGMAAEVTKNQYARSG